MAIVMGGAENNRKTAALGGSVGGIGLGVLILLSHLAIVNNISPARVPLCRWFSLQ